MNELITQVFELEELRIQDLETQYEVEDLIIIYSHLS